MVFLFHPVMSFLIPLAVACLLCPSASPVLPGPRLVHGPEHRCACDAGLPRLLRVAVVAINSGGPVNLALNVALILVLLLILARLARPGLSVADGRPIVVCGRRGFLALCLYLILLYGVTYRFLRPEALPSAPIQLFTFVFYAIAIMGLAAPLPSPPLS